jgi:hypothetical protein
MGNDGALERESLLESAEAPAQEALHIVSFPSIDDNELVLGYNDQANIPLSVGAIMKSLLILLL